MKQLTFFPEVPSGMRALPKAKQAERAMFRLHFTSPRTYQMAQRRMNVQKFATLQEARIAASACPRGLWWAIESQNHRGYWITILRGHG